MMLIYLVVCMTAAWQIKFIQASWFSSDSVNVDYSPIIIIPGDGGNQLEAKLNKPPDNSGCARQSDWFRLWLDVYKLSGRKLKCWSDNIKLVYNSTTRQSSNVPGVATRVPAFGGTASVEYLDPSWSAWVLADAGNYMKTFVDFFVENGYTRGKDIRAAPYDFRFAPHSQEKYFIALKSLIEATSRENQNKAVTIISHSMGGLFGLHFLQRQDYAWRARYINSFIPISCPWVGALLQMNTYASGYNLGITITDPKIIREEQRSYETGVYLLPHPYHWTDQDQILVTTPTRNYTVRDYYYFFHDIGFPQGIDMLDNVVNITRLEHPGVRTHNVYSVGVDTPAGMIYDYGFPDEQPVQRIMGDGDGTVTVESLRFAKNFLRPEAGDTGYQFSGLNHGQILKSKKVLQYLRSLLTL